MQRFLLFAALVGLLVAVPLTHAAQAKPAGKVMVCHLNGGNVPGVLRYTDLVWGEEFVTTYRVGKWIEVSENALPGHLAHGDRQYAEDLVTDYYDWAYIIEHLEDWNVDPAFDNTNGVIRNGDCFFRE